MQQLLGAANVSSVRIDGTVSNDERVRYMEAFRSGQDIPVLLMTMGTGAVGLNLTAANYIHVVEPQWSPSVEEQAVARAVRMGQTRTVTVIRYVVERSVEQVKKDPASRQNKYMTLKLMGSGERNIVHLQKKKKHLAKFALNGTDETAAGKLDDLKFIIDFDSIV
ncbi:uncharacterized protein DNG_05800 [Cephalotrichum gorgonifer]|uniref:Helicase C-terminal domain-containing protein n=1 Tax=Cephalotrichum gorgonifer TaxID=2041049 RepID=A0AAE8SVV5_9PEZI|nr:uncharacterized protein DNG_05800 [Cephalotrichum gorgonifer]